MTEKEVLEIIEEAARDGRTRLNLAGKGIRSLPGEVGKRRFVTDSGVARKTTEGIESDLGVVYETCT